ncbi:MAG: hypothetical protein HYV28_07135 [Ignavibacteriales bacterium]|nr:hypothetical protein [Ignavibacteriales bacterium]
MRFDFLPVASEFVQDEEAITGIIPGFIQQLEFAGGIRISQASVMTSRPLFYFAVTGGVENIILELHKKRDLVFPGEPAYIIAHPGNNSLPAALEILARLQQDGIKGNILYLPLTNNKYYLDKILHAAHNLAVYRKLQNARIGCIGAPSDWLVASMPPASVVKSTWGPEIISLDTAKVMEYMSAVSESNIIPIRESLVNGATAIIEPSDEEISGVVRVYTALKQISKEENLDALTIRCFDLVQQLKTTGCFALAELTDEGIIAGCEGDLMSTIGLFWANLLTGLTPWMANPAQLDEEKNRLWLAHCTVPRKLVTGYKLRSHFESGLGLGIQGTWNESAVTLLRIGGKNMEKIWLAEGTIIQNGTAENLCRTQIEIQIENGGHVSDLLNAPLGNHIVVINGYHMHQLRDWHKTMLPLTF